MAAQEPKKTLRIGIYRGKTPLQERTMDKRRTVSVGRNEANTFCVLSSTVPDKWNLFVYDSAKDSYALCLDKSSMRARVIVEPGKEVLCDENLSAQPGVEFIADKVYISLTNQSRGRVVIGKIKILFAFDEKASRPSDAARKEAELRLFQKSSSLMDLGSENLSRALAIGIIASLLLHLGPLFFIGAQDWPREDYLMLPPQSYKAVVIEEMVLDDEKLPEEIEEPDILENTDDTNKIDETPSEEDNSGATKEELLDQITDKHREQGAQITAQILGVEGGVDGFFAEMLGDNTHIADMSDIAAGDIGASASGSLLNQLAAGEGGGQGAGLLGLDNKVSGGPQVVVDNTQTKKTTTRAKAEFKMSDTSEFASAPPPGSKQAIESMFKKKKNDITGCYQRVMNAQGKASGRLVINIVVNKDGSVMKVEKAEDQIGGEMFSCVRQRIMNWNFGTLEKPIAFKKTWVFS